MRKFCQSRLETLSVGFTIFFWFKNAFLSFWASCKISFYTVSSLWLSWSYFKNIIGCIFRYTPKPEWKWLANEPYETLQRILLNDFVNKNQINTGMNWIRNGTKKKGIEEGSNTAGFFLILVHKLLMIQASRGGE